MSSRGCFLDEQGEEVVAWSGTCRAEGCDRDIYGPSRGYRGYCAKHGRLFYFNGEPLTIKEIQRRAYREAAIAYADSQTWENRVALCAAALNCKNRNVSDIPGPDFLLMVTTRPGQRVVDACMEWADFDAEAPMAEYMIVREAMYAQAKCFEARYRQLSYRERHGHEAVLAAQRESAARMRERQRVEMQEAA